MERLRTTPEQLLKRNIKLTLSNSNSEPLFMGLEGPMIWIAVAALTFFHPGVAFAGQWKQANFSLRGRMVPRGNEGTRLDSRDGFAHQSNDFAGKGGAGSTNTTPA